MNYGKRIALNPRSSTITDSDSAFGEDYDDDPRSHKKAVVKDKQTRNLSEKKRRDQFNLLVNELSTMVSHTSSKKMDKSTVLKSTIAFLKNYQETTTQAQVHEIKEDWKPTFLTNDEFMHLMLEALDSFLLVCTQQGTILYASEGVTSLLGHLPGDLQNRSIFNLVSENEKVNLQNLLYNYTVVAGDGVPEYEKEENQLCFECHMRRGGLDPHGPIMYEPVTVMGSFRHAHSQSGDDDIGTTISKEQVCFCSTVRLQNSQLVHEMSTVDDNREFKSRHSLEWKFLFLDHRAPPIIGYLPFEVLGTSGYDYYHPDDLEGVTKSHEQLMKTGEGTSCYYRFLTKGQQWIWLKTKYYITYHQWSSKPEFINCTNTVVSYADVRAHKRRELGIVEDDVTKVEPDLSSFFRKMSRSPSAGSVTSGGQPGSNWSSSPTHDSHTDQNSGCAIADKDQSSRPSSTTRSKEQLHEFLQRHIQQQAAAAAQAGSSSSQHSSSGQVPSHHSLSTQSLQQLLLRRQQQQQQQQQQQHMKQDIRPQRILPRPSTSYDHQNKVVQQQLVSNTDSNTVTVSLPASQAVTPLIFTQGSPKNIYMTPVQRQLQRKAHQTQGAPKNIYMTPVQRQLHEQLQRKARQVQDAIVRQQEELQKIAQQLAFTQGVLPISGPNVGGENMVGMMGQVSSSDLSIGNVRSPAAPSTMPRQHQSHHHHQQQQQQQQGDSQPLQILNMGPPTVMIDSSPFLTFPVLPNDAEVLLSLADSSETHPGLN